MLFFFSYLLVGEFFLIEFVGLMWLVVIELLKMFRVCVFLIVGIDVVGFIEKLLLKNGGLVIYVDFG